MNLNLDEIEEVATASTPGPLAWGIHPAETVDEAAAWMAESIRKCPGTTVHMVVQGSPGEEIADGKVTAYTGNGPTSEANAIFYAGARQAVLLLITEVRQLRRILKDVEDLHDWPDLHTEVRRLREALAVYADEENWDWWLPYEGRGVHEWTGPAPDSHPWQIAQDVLKGERDEP